MVSMLTVRLSDGMKAEIERIVGEVGLWHNQSEFVKEGYYPNPQKRITKN